MVKNFKQFINEDKNDSSEIIAYHGTTDKGYSTYKYMYYTADYEYAKQYAQSTGRVEQVSIKYKKPFIIDAKYMGYGEIILNDEIIGYYRDLTLDAVEKLKTENYDIIIINYPTKNKNAFEIIPFDKNQVTILNKKYNESLRDYVNEQHEELLAPNGNISNLTPDLYKLVRTTEFKRWFGDWKNEPNNSSKVVDENGEPLIVYHRTFVDFEEFDNTKGSYKKGFVGGNFFYFSDDRYGYSDYGDKEIAVFINLRNPTYKVNVDGEYIKSSNDGAILKFNRFDEKESLIVATKPNQIKSIKNTKFTNSNNIYS